MSCLPDSKPQDWLHGHVTCAFIPGSVLGIVLCCHHLKILSNFRTRGPTFLFYTGFHKLGNQSCQDFFPLPQSPLFTKSGGFCTNKTLLLIKELWEINYCRWNINMWTIIYGCFCISTYKYPQFRAKSPSPDNPCSDFLWFLGPPQCCKWEPSQEVGRKWYEV